MFLQLIAGSNLVLIAILSLVQALLGAYVFYAGVYLVGASVNGECIEEE